jgi:hypothetical protein
MVPDSTLPDPDDEESIEQALNVRIPMYARYYI